MTASPIPPRRRRPQAPPACRPAVLLLLALAAAALAGCDGGPQRPVKPQTSALWVDADALATLEPSALDRLRQAGVRELFLEGPRLTWSGDARPHVEPGLARGAARRAPVTLVISGGWPPGLEESAAEVAAALATELKRLRLEAGAAGLVPVGVHLDLDLPAGELAALAAVLGELAPALGDDLFLSARLDRAHLGAEGAEALARAADFTVTPLYGQRPGEAESAAAWKLDQVLADAARLEELGGRYMIEVVTLGAAYRLGSGGGREDSTTEATLADLARNPALEPTRGRLLEGWDRRVYTVEATRATGVAGWRLAAGERVRAVQLRAREVDDLRRRLGEAGLAGHLGELYYRAPRPGEGLSLSLGALARVLAGTPAEPRLEVEVLEPRADGSRLSFRLLVRNAGAQATDVAFLEANYIEVRVPDGVFERVEAGGFRRYAMMQGDHEATHMRAFRRADTARLFVSLLEPGEEVTSGPIIVRGNRGEPRLVLGGRFALPGAVLYDLPPTPWVRRPGES